MRKIRYLIKGNKIVVVDEFGGVDVYSVDPPNLTKTYAVGYCIVSEVPIDIILLIFKLNGWRETGVYYFNSFKTI